MLAKPKPRNSKESQKEDQERLPPASIEAEDIFRELCHT
jgi:hypothetical protein